MSAPVDPVEEVRARKARRLKGCFFGAGIAVLLLGLLIAFVVVKLNKPRPSVAAHHIITPRTVAVFHVQPDLEDPEVTAMLQAMTLLWIEKAAQQQQQLPGNMWWLNNLQSKPDPAEAFEEVQTLLPSDVAVALEDSGDGDPAWVALASLPRMSRLYMGIYVWAFTVETRKSKHETSVREYNIYTDHRGSNWHAAVRGSSALLSSDRGELTRLLDRIDAGETQTVETDLARSYNQLASEGQARSVLVLEPDVVAAVTRATKTGASTGSQAQFDPLTRINRQMGNACDQATWRAEVVADNAIEMVATMRCRGGAEARQVARTLPALLIPYEQKLTAHKLSVQRRIEASDDGFVRVTWDVRDILAGLEVVIDDLYAQGGYTTPPPLGTQVP